MRETVDIMAVHQRVDGSAYAVVRRDLAIDPAREGGGRR